MRTLARATLALALALAACAKAEESPGATDKDAGFVGRGGDVDPGPDPTPVDPTPTPDASTDSGGGGSCTGKIVINELLPAGSAASDEFIELYNPSTCEVGIEGFKLSYKSSSGTPTGGAPLHTFAAGTTIKGKGFVVVGTTAFKGTKDATFNGGGVTVNGGMAADGQVALLDAGGQKMDSVGYGGTTGDYIEKAPAPKAPATASIARKADGVDTDDNSKDFDWMTTPTPGAKNAP
jgi:hypothetical protein